MQIAYRANIENEAYYAAKRGTLRGCLRYPSERACYMWLNPGVLDLSVHAAGLRSCQRIEAMPSSTCGPRAPPPTFVAIAVAAGRPHPHATIGPCHCSLLPGIRRCDTPGRLRLVRTSLALFCRTMTISTLFSHNFTQTTICLDLYVACAPLFTSRATDVRPSHSGHGSAIIF